MTGQPQPQAQPRGPAHRIRTVALGIVSMALAWAGLACSSSSARGPVPHEETERSEETPGLPFYGEPTFTPKWHASADQLPEGFHRVEAFELTNQLGDTITAETFAGRLYVANFFFTSCSGICAKMNRNVARVQDTFADADDVMFLSHSVTPDIDTPAVLRTYGERFGSTPGKWHLATGSKEHIYALGREAYFVEEDQGLPQPNAFLHSENLVLVDRQGHIRGIYNGLNRTEVDLLIADIATLRGS